MGHQHLFTVMAVDRTTPSLCTRHDLDWLVRRVDGDSVNSDSMRHLYLYRQPESLAAETELMNRRSGQRVEKVAR